MREKLKKMGEPHDPLLAPPHISGKAEKAIIVIGRCSSCWRWVSGMATFRAGLDYIQAEYVASMSGVKMSKSFFGILQIAEQAIIEQDEKRREKDG